MWNSKQCRILLLNTNFLYALLPLIIIITKLLDVTHSNATSDMVFIFLHDQNKKEDQHVQGSNVQGDSMCTKKS